MKYIIYKGMKKEVVEADSVGLITDDDKEFELQYRKSDNEINLRANKGCSLVILPKAGNVVRVDSVGRADHNNLALELLADLTKEVGNLDGCAGDSLLDEAFSAARHYLEENHPNLIE